MYEQSAMSRQFVASPGRFGLGPNFSYIQLYGLAAVIALPRRPLCIQRSPTGPLGHGDQVTGTALHLHSASQRFVLGGRDHRVGEGTRLDEPPVIGVDAWLPADRFDELLAVVGPGSGLDVRSPAPGGPVRCLLFPNAMRAQQMGPFAAKKRRDFLLSITHAKLAIDVDADEIRVTNYRSNTLITSAGPGQITAEPTTYQYRGGGLYGVSSLGGSPRTGRNSMPLGDTGNGRAPSRDAGTDDRVS